MRDEDDDVAADDVVRAAVVRDEDDDVAGDNVVPAAFAVTVVRNEDQLKPYELEALKGEDVVVRANGFSYRGKLVGADEGELYLRGELRWVVLPLATITSVAKEIPPRHLGLPVDLPVETE